MLYKSFYSLAKLKYFIKLNIRKMFSFEGIYTYWKRQRIYQETYQSHGFWAHGTLDTRHRIRKRSEQDNLHEGFQATYIAASS